MSQTTNVLYYKLCYGKLALRDYPKITILKRDTMFIVIWDLHTIILSAAEKINTTVPCYILKPVLMWTCCYKR